VQPEFAAILGVKDERELLPHCMAQLARIGVDRVFAIDCGSSDGSVEWLEAHAGDRLQFVRHDDRDPDAADQWERLNLRLARDSGADWVLFLDADEFWIPAGGFLRDCASLADHDVLQVHRFNVPLGPRGACLGAGDPPGPADALSLIVAPVPQFRARLASHAGLPWIRGEPVPQVMARPERIAGLAVGGHDIAGADGGPLRRATPADLLIAHLPFTSAARFERKLENIRRIFAVHDAFYGPDLAWHWRRWLELPDPRAVHEEFARQRFDEATLAALRAERIVMTASQWFAREASRDG
jgi:glycosyltransferase involved in cell wall biosynthesis